MRVFSMIAMVAAVCALAVAASAQDEGSTWEVPEEARAEENPVENTDEAVTAGGALYKKHCTMCHGDALKGDGPATQFIKPAPPDISTKADKERMTDGEIFYKITTGKRPMPAMQRKMSDEERWQVVLYLRTLQTN